MHITVINFKHREKFQALCLYILGLYGVSIYKFFKHTMFLQLIEATTTDQIQEIISNNSTIILDSGYSQLLGDVGVEEKFLHSTVYKVMGELEQLKAGLNELGVADQMKTNLGMFKDYFTYSNNQELTAGVHIKQN